MLSPEILFAGLVNGLMAGGIYVLVAVGLTLIYGVLHIINFAHGSLLMLAMYAVFFLWRKPLGLDPYVALPIVTAGAFAFGYLLYRALIGHFSHGKDENILLITLGLSIIIDNAALFFFTGDTQTIDVAYAGRMICAGAGAGGAAQARLLRRSAGDLPPARPLHDAHRHGQGHSRRRQGAAGRAPRRHRRGGRDGDLVRHRHRLPRAPPPAC